MDDAIWTIMWRVRYAAAECDCTAALALDPGYVKVYARRGAARAAQDRLHDARDDFLTVLKLEPRNKQAATEVDRLAGVRGRGKGRQMERGEGRGEGGNRQRAVGSAQGEGG